MSARPHDRLEELIAAAALGGLDEADRVEMEREMASHGPDCAECRRLVEEYEEVAGRLAFALDSLPMAAGAEDRLIVAARATAPAPGSIRVLESRGRPRRTRPGGMYVRRWLVAAAAAVIALVAGSVGYVLAPSGAGLRTVTLPATGGQRLAVVYVPGSEQALLVGSNLDAPPAGKVYELWYIARKEANPTPAGTFKPDSNGGVLMRTTVGPAFVALAVSVEPPGGSKKPTNVILVRSV